MAFDGADVLLADRSRIQPDVVLASTGYRRRLDPLVGHLAVLDPTGRLKVNGPRTDPAAPNLYFMGFTNSISGYLRELGFTARKIARAMARQCTVSR